MEEIDVRVVLKPKRGRKKILKGDIAMALISALHMIDERKKIPKNVSLAEAAAMAISLGHKTPKEIVDYIERYIQRCSTP